MLWTDEAAVAAAECRPPIGVSLGSLSVAAAGLPEHSRQVMARDYYLVLGVDAEASPEQIQAAYKHWTRALQPDTAAAPSEALRELQDAYSVLGHPTRRQAYDRQRGQSQAEPLRPPRSEAEPMAASSAPEVIEFSLRSAAVRSQPSFEELFDRLWGNFEGLARPKAERVESLTVEIRLSPEEAQRGGRARILIPARAQCPACLGHGSVGLYQCWRCEGQGAITSDYPLEVSYPAGIQNEHLERLPLDRFGIENFYLTVRFRVGQPNG